jgi:hypothetical protein
MCHQILRTNQETKNEAIYKNTNPTQGFNMAGGLDELNTKSTYSFGANKMNAHGSPSENTLVGVYIQLLSSLAKAFDVAIIVIVGDPLNPQTAKSIKEIQCYEYCFF